MANLTREEAWELVKEYNKDPFHLRHALTVEGVMRWYANELGYGGGGRVPCCTLSAGPAPARGSVPFLSLHS